jgi:DNA-binding MarR family transcriptional regulator
VSTRDWQTATAVLRTSAQLIDGIQDGLSQRGFSDVRPVHGFAFAVLAAQPCTTAGLADQLSVTKQAAAQLAAYLVERGYVRRRPHPDDGRATLLELTAKGHRCTAAAEQAAADTVRQWRRTLGAPAFAALAQGLQGIAEPGRLRPSW